MHFNFEYKRLTNAGEQALSSTHQYIRVYGRRLSFQEVLINWILALFPIYLMFGICGISIGIEFDAFTWLTTCTAIVISIVCPGAAYHRKTNRQAIVHLNFLLHRFPDFYLELFLAERAGWLWDYSHKQVASLLRKELSS